MYVKDYYADIGVRPGTRFDVIVELLGEPKDIVRSVHVDYLATVIYEGIEFVVEYGKGATETGVVSGVRVFSPDIRFGRRQIGISSTRDELRRAYRRVGWHWENDSQMGFTDGITWITFNINENDQVTRISLTTF